MYQERPPKQTLLWALAISITYLTNGHAIGSAQTGPITSSGLNTQISDPIQIGSATQYNITGGTRPGGGVNLFHSFGKFGIPNDSIANFHNDSPGLQTSNILGRVTGGSESQIFGTIRTSEFGTANLFLMNPAGFLFGPNATVNVGGMVSFTSADYLKLEDGKRFNAIPSTAVDALLSASPVAAFGFLGSNPGAIIVRGSEFNAASISLVGGNITIESGTPSGNTVQQAQLSAADGTIRLASATSPGAFDTTLQAIPNVNETSFTSFGTVSLAPGSTINVSGTNTVSIRGGQFVLSANNATLNTAKIPGAPGNVLLSTSSTIVAQTFGTDPGGTITVSAEETIVLHGNSSITSRTDAQGNAGQVHLQAPSIEMQELSNIVTSTAGLGHAGNVNLSGDQINISSDSFITTRTSAQGHGGNVTLRGLTGEGSWASDINLSGASKIVSETIGDGINTQGPAGNIHIETTRLNLSGASHFNSTSRGSTGDAGTISVSARDSVTISGSGSRLVSDSAEFSFGNAGNISITAPSITIENSGGISSSTSLEGNAGTITVSTNNLRLLSGGHINSSSLIEFSEAPPSGSAGSVIVHGLTIPAQTILIDGADSRISTDTHGSGLGGSISIDANSVTLQNGGRLSAQTFGTDPSAIGGTITMNATHVQLHSGATITAHSNGVANAGNIDITASDGLTMQNSSVTTLVHPNNNGSNAGGGNIKITTSPNATVYLHDGSTISASVADGPGGGGDVTIDPQYVILQGSQILAQTDQGRGGNITIIANVFQPDATSIVNADAERGVNGTVTIQSPSAPASGKIQPLGNRPLQATVLLTQRCAAADGGEFSSFTVSANSLPLEPGGWLPSPLISVFPKAHGNTMIGTTLRSNSSRPIGDRSLLTLRQITPAGFLIQAFASPWSGGCTSS